MILCRTQPSPTRARYLRRNPGQEVTVQRAGGISLSATYHTIQCTLHHTTFSLSAHYTLYHTTISLSAHCTGISLSPHWHTPLLHPTATAYHYQHISVCYVSIVCPLPRNILYTPSSNFTPTPVCPNILISFQF